MPNFGGLTAIYQGAVNYPDLTLRRRRTATASVSPVSSRRPRTGFMPSGFDRATGRSFYLDGDLVVNHDGVHSPSELSGWAALAAGKHTVNVQYFFNAQNSNAGDLTDQIDVSWQGPSFAKTDVPVSGSRSVPSIRTWVGILRFFWIAKWETLCSQSAIPDLMYV